VVTHSQDNMFLLFLVGYDEMHDFILLLVTDIQAENTIIEVFKILLLNYTLILVFTEGSAFLFDICCVFAIFDCGCIFIT